MSKTEFLPILRTRSAIASTAIKNGQLLASFDTGECFVDANNARVRIGDIIKVPSADALPIAPLEKLYFSEEDLCFFYPTYVDDNLVWEQIGIEGTNTPGDSNFYVSITGEELTITQTESPGSSAVSSITVTGETMTFIGG